MEEKVVELLSELQNAITTLAPEAWLALVLAAKVTAYRNVVIGALAALWFATYAWIALRRVVPFLCSNKQASDVEIGTRVGFLFVGGFSAVICFMIAIVFLGGTDTWLGLFYPEAQVVRDLLNAAKP